MNMMNKKGISPIIATVLLIVIAIALFVLIFLWVRSFQGERISKFGAPIENACPNVQLELTMINPQLQIENIGNVPVYKIQIFELSGGSTNKLQDETINLLAGSTTTVGVTCSDQLKIVPVLLGTTEKGAQKEYICKDKQIIVLCS